MADPFTWTAIVVAVAATALSTYSTIQSSQAQARQQRYNAALAKREADQQALYAEREATLGLRQGMQEREAAAFESEQLRTQAERAEARQRALVGASAVQLTGSPLLAYLDNVRQHELEAELAEYRGEVRARSAEDQAQLAQFQARELRQSGQLSLASGRLQARQTETAGYVNAGATLLSGAANTYNIARRPQASGARGQTGVGSG